MSYDESMGSRANFGGTSSGPSMSTLSAMPVPPPRPTMPLGATREEINGIAGRLRAANITLANALDRYRRFMMGVDSNGAKAAEESTGADMGVADAISASHEEIDKLNNLLEVLNNCI